MKLFAIVTFSALTFFAASGLACQFHGTGEYYMGDDYGEFIYNRPPADPDQQREQYLKNMAKKKAVPKTKPSSFFSFKRVQAKPNKVDDKKPLEKADMAEKAKANVKAN